MLNDANKGCKPILHSIHGAKHHATRRVKDGVLRPNNGSSVSIRSGAAKVIGHPGRATAVDQPTKVTTMTGKVGTPLEAGGTNLASGEEGTRDGSQFARHTRSGRNVEAT